MHESPESPADETSPEHDEASLATGLDDAEDAPLSIQLGPSKSKRLYLTMLMFEVALGLVALAIGYWLESPSWRYWNWSGEAWWQGTLGTIPPVIMLFVMLFVMLYTDWDPLSKFRDLLEQRVIPMFAALSWWQLLLLAAAAGWGEELLFRGLLQPLFELWLGKWPGIAALATLFGLAHALSPLYFALTVVMSVYLSWLLDSTGNLAVPIVVHGLYDSIALLIMHKKDAVYSDS